jgi:hypothetical protein
VRDASTGAVDLMQNGQGWRLSPVAYDYLGHPAYTTISDAAFKAIPAGPNYTIPNGACVRDASTGEIDMIENGQRCWLAPAVYASLGRPPYVNIPDIHFVNLPSGPVVIPKGWNSVLSTTNGYAPGYSAQYLQTGSAVKVYGSGFVPGTRVKFGSYSGFLATPTAIDPKGTWLTVNVPRYATSGPLQLIFPNGTVIKTTETFTVHDYLNTFGFSFQNFGFNVTWGMVKGEFGGDQVDITVGVPFTSLQYDTGVPSPLALAFWGVLAASMNGKGACFGMALASDKLAASGFTPYSLPETASLNTMIEENQLGTGSAEMIHYAAGWALSGHSAQGVYNQLSSLLASGDHPIICLGSGAWHAVTAYDLEPGPKGNGDYYIDIYDSNRPADPFNDALQEMASRIYIDPSKGWSFQMAGGSTYGGGYGADSFMVVPSSVLSGNLTMPASLSGLLTIIFGSGVAAPAAPGTSRLAAQPLASDSVIADGQLREVRPSSRPAFFEHPGPTGFTAGSQQVAGDLALALAQTAPGKHGGGIASDMSDLFWLENGSLLDPMAAG